MPMIRWTDEVSAIAALVTAGAAVIALFGLVWAALEAARSRHAALMAELSRRWDEESLVQSRDEVSRYTPDRLALRIEFLEDAEQLAELQVLYRLPNFLEDLAVLQRQHAISYKMIRLSLGGTYVHWWDHWKPAALFLRGDETYDLIYENMERLAERLRKKIARRNRGRTPRNTP